MSLCTKSPEFMPAPSAQENVQLTMLHLCNPMFVTVPHDVNPRHATVCVVDQHAHSGMRLS